VGQKTTAFATKVASLEKTYDGLRTIVKSLTTGLLTLAKSDPVAFAKHDVFKAGPEGYEQKMTHMQKGLSSANEKLRTMDAGLAKDLSEFEAYCKSKKSNPLKRFKSEAAADTAILKAKVLKAKLDEVVKGWM
jgi:hypothetical protein